jgi:hypothetical protein
MSQHDYNIANQSGADFRADLNNALSAIASTNSGDTEPTTTFANQLWIDTANNVLKIRNEGNTDWVATGLSITADNTFIGTITANNANIILNYSTGDSSSTANGAGITIQDAVSVGNDASLTWNTNVDRFNLSHGLDFPDDALIAFGDGDDLRLFHNGTASKIQNFTGHFDIQNAADGNDIRLGSDDGSGGIVNYFRIDGGDQISVASKNIRFEDNVKSTFGDSDNLQIYNDGTKSHITESTGEIYVNGTFIDDQNVKSYGATGDGTTDDTTAIENAIAANLGKTLFFPKGDYLVTSEIEINSGIALLGELGTTIKIGSTMNSGAVFLIKATDIPNRNLKDFSITNFEFDGSAIVTGYWLQDSNGNAINNPHTDYIGSGALASGISGVSLTAIPNNGVITGVTVNNGGSGFNGHPTHPYQPNQVPLHFGTAAGGYGAFALGNITNGSITSVTMVQGGSGYTSTPSVIPQGGYADIDLLVEPSIDRRNPNYNSVVAAIWTKGTVDTKIENCFFNTIPGRAIFDQGSLGLDINKCTFEACGKKDGAFHTIYAQSNVDVPSEDIRIRNCRATNLDRSFVAFNPKGGGIIENCYIDGYKEACIFMNQNAAVTKNQVVIKNNTMINGTASDIVCHAIEAGRVQNLIIDGNYIENCQEYPLVLTGIVNSKVINNTFVNNGLAYDEPYAPFSERYTFGEGEYPIAGRENDLEGRPAVATLGTLSDVGSEYLMIKNNSVIDDRATYPSCIFKQTRTGSASTNLARGGDIEGNIFDVPSDMEVLDTSTASVWEYPYFPRIRHNSNSASTAPVIVFKEFSNGETGNFTVDCGFMPSYVETIANPNNGALGRSGSGFISFDPSGDNDFATAFASSDNDQWAASYANEFIRLIDETNTVKFGAEFGSWNEKGFTINVITCTSLHKVRFICHP